MKTSAPYIPRRQAQQFVDRFNEAIIKPEDNPLLFNVWGIGGVGKTTLVNRIENYFKNIDFARVSFGETLNIATPISLMATINQKLPSVSGWKVSGNSDLFTKLHNKYRNTLKELEQVNPQDSEAQAKERIEASKALKNRWKNIVTGTVKNIPAVKDVPGAELISGTLAESGVELSQWLKKQNLTKNDRELQDLMLNPLTKLTEAFVRRLITNSKQKSVVLLLDTYEKSDSEINNWLWQYLVANSELRYHPVRIIVAGRNNLLKQEHWSKIKQDLSLVDSLEIFKFDLTQTQSYLETVGINTEQTEEIYRVTNGLPYYLDWIRQQVAKNVDLDYSQGNQAIVNLLSQGLDDKQKKLVQLTACCRNFNRSLIQDLVTSQEIDFAMGVDKNLNCFEWLIKLDFVELVENKYRLDDVARDIFRFSLWQEDEKLFKQVNHFLAGFYNELADEEAVLHIPLLQLYGNLEWKEFKAESLYHNLYSGKSDCTAQFLEHLLIACYLRETEVVSIPFNAITSEIDLDNVIDRDILTSGVKKFLKKLQPILIFTYLAFDEKNLAHYFEYSVKDEWLETLSTEEKLNNYIEQEGIREQILQVTFSKKQISAKQFNLTQKLVLEYITDKNLDTAKKTLEPAVKYCFGQVNHLTGLAKFICLIYQVMNSLPSLKIEYLKQATNQYLNILQDFDNELTTRIFLDLGSRLSEIDRFEEAILIYDQVVHNNPNSYRAWHNRGACLSDLGKFEEAIPNYEKAIEIKSDKHIAFYNLSVSMHQLDKYDDALKYIDRALELEPNFYLSWYLRGRVLGGNLHKWDKALENYNKSLEIKPDYANTWLYRSMALKELERYDDALKSIDRALELEPTYSMAWNYRSIPLKRLGKYEEACESVNNALKLEPNNPEFWSYYGLCLYESEKIEEAFESIDRALTLMPNNNFVVDTYKVILETHIERYDKLLTSNPEKDEDNIWFYRGIYLSKLGKYDEAIESIEKAIELNSDEDYEKFRENILNLLIEKYDELLASNPEKDEDNIWFYRGIYLSKLGKYDEAIESIEKAIELNPDEDYEKFRENILNLLIEIYDKLLTSNPEKDEDNIWFYRGIYLSKLGKINECVESVKKAIKINPENKVYSSYKYLLFERLANLYKSWLNSEPENVNHLSSYGDCLVNLGQYKEALKIYDKALKLDPDSAITFYNLACYYAMQNQAIIAIEKLMRAINLDPHWREAAKTNPDFDLIRANQQFKFLINSHSDF